MGNNNEIKSMESSAQSEPPLGGNEKPNTTLREDVAAAGLEKVYERHGRIDLVPMPSDDPNDPYNFAPWRKNALLIQVAFNAMMGPFSAAATIPAFESFVEEFGISITTASYTVSIVIIFIGTFPLLWQPIAARVGRRPVYIGATLVAAGMHLAGAYCNSYGTLMITRVFQAIFLAPAQSIGAQTVNELFFQHEKGAKLGVWALLTTLGPPLAPFLMGFVVFHLSWHWIFYLLAMINLGQVVFYILLGPETLFDRPVRDSAGRDVISDDKYSGTSPTAWYTPYITLRRWSREPWSRLPIDVVRPLAMALRLPVLLASVAYAITFAFCNVNLTVLIPALVGRKYELNAQQVGLQFIAPLLGAVLGEPIAGAGSDAFVRWRTKRANGQREPEMRLPFALPGFIISAVGLIVFGVQLQNTAPGRWSVTPLIGSAIALFGLQLVTTVCITYAIESQPRHLAPRVPLFVAFFRQLYAFTAPFYLNEMYETMGDAKASGLLAALVGGVAFLIALSCLVYGRKWRQRDAQRDEAVLAEK